MTLTQAYRGGDTDRRTVEGIGDALWVVRFRLVEEVAA